MRAEREATGLIAVMLRYCLRLAVTRGARWSPINHSFDLAVNHALFFNDHVELHVALIASSDVQSIHGDLWVTGCLHTDCRGCAAHDNGEEGEKEEESCVGGLDRTVRILELNRGYHIIDPRNYFIHHIWGDLDARLGQIIGGMLTLNLWCVSFQRNRKGNILYQLPNRNKDHPLHPIN